MAKLKVLMVCLGNICRSPLAEGILKNKVDHHSIAVDSAGTSATHAGELPDPRSIEVAQKYGIDITDQRSRPFKKNDFSKFDQIYVMDQQNYKDVISQASSDENRNKVSLILNALEPKSNAEVPDPYYGGKNGFEHVYNLLDQACNHIANQLQKDGNS